MQITTPRLLIRPIQQGDEIILEEMSRDGSFSELGLDSDCAEWIGEWIDEAVSLAEQDNPKVDYICWIVCLKDDGKVIGTVGNTFYEDTGKIGITYGIGAEYRQKG
ncbi:GNAT family N-acetyltransferase, partial [bacterium]|nr:GNAT family N-acetyltransferase [bacterium]